MKSIRQSNHITLVFRVGPDYKLIDSLVTLATGEKVLFEMKKWVNEHNPKKMKAFIQQLVAAWLNKGDVPRLIYTTPDAAAKAHIERIINNYADDDLNEHAANVKMMIGTNFIGYLSTHVLD
jgi:hypothetical protein